MSRESLEIKQNTTLTRMTRLEIAKLCNFLGKDPWQCISNESYRATENPSLSVIITLFNYSEYIYECLDSVCASYTSELLQEFEILVIDDCSTDNSANLVEEYLTQSNVAICLVKKLFNTGLSDARNVGLSLSRSSYVFMLDADNWVYPNCLSTLYAAILSNNCASVYGIINKFDSSTREGKGLVSCYEWDIYELLREPYIDAMAMFDREVLIKLGGYSTELVYGWEDYDLWLKLAQSNYNCKLVPEILSAYRVHSLSMINHTNQYTLEIARYFHRKFSNLIKKYEKDLDKIFGVPLMKDSISGQLQMIEPQVNTEPVKVNHFVEEKPVSLKYQVKRTRDRIEKAQIQLDKTYQKIEKARLRIQQAQNDKIVETVASHESK